MRERRRSTSKRCRIVPKPAVVACAVPLRSFTRATYRVVRSTKVPTWAAVARAFDVIAFPMSRHKTFCHVGRALINARHVGNLSAPILSA